MDDAPVLLGRMSLDQVRVHLQPSSEAEPYEPEPGPLELIASLPSEVTVEVVWGSWCSDSGRELSRYFTILDRVNALRRERGLGDLPIRSEFIAVDREKKEPADLLEGKAIELVPTFRVLDGGGNEVGRIVEKPQGTLAEDLALLLLEAMATD